MDDKTKKKLEQVMKEAQRAARKASESGCDDWSRHCIGEISGIADAVRIMDPDLCVITDGKNYKIVDAFHTNFMSMSSWEKVEGLINVDKVTGDPAPYLAKHEVLQEAMDQMKKAGRGFDPDDMGDTTFVRINASDGRQYIAENTYKEEYEDDDYFEKPENVENFIRSAKIHTYDSDTGDVVKIEN